MCDVKFDRPPTLLSLISGRFLLLCDDCDYIFVTSGDDIADVLENLFNVSTEEFFSKKITNKLVQQLQVAYLCICSLSVLQLRCYCVE